METSLQIQFCSILFIFHDNTVVGTYTMGGREMQIFDR